MEETIRDIKKELRANMNGIASAQMRRAGMPHHVVWGIELPRLRDIAAEFPSDRKLGQRLWNENVRESRLLGILLTPPEDFLPEVADIWVHEAATPETASLLAMELIVPQTWATNMAFHWIAGTDNLAALCGWLTICRLLQNGGTLMPRSEAELRDHATAVPENAPLYLRKAVLRTMEAITASSNYADNTATE
ncbi:MAG: DNA alkylation repair protein [Bacteroidaceae bacterium]|nr:DNA alkylation repair protein [Bacteroidaceae bacterium]